MMTKNWKDGSVDPAEISISIKRDAKYATVLNADGGEIAKFPSYFTDDDVNHVLKEMHRAYIRGVKQGMYCKAQEINEALSFTPQDPI